MVMPFLHISEMLICLSFYGFCYNLEGELNAHFLVKAYGAGVVAKSLHCILDNDKLAVNVVAELFESFRDLESTNRTVDSVVGTCLGSDDDLLYAIESCGGSLCVGFELCDLVGTLTLVFGEHLEGAFGCDDSLALRNEVIAAVAVLYFYDIILVSKVGDVLF